MVNQTVKKLISHQNEITQSIIAAEFKNTSEVSLSKLEIFKNSIFENLFQFLGQILGCPCHIFTE